MKYNTIKNTLFVEKRPKMALQRTKNRSHSKQNTLTHVQHIEATSNSAQGHGCLGLNRKKESYEGLR